MKSIRAKLLLGFLCMTALTVILLWLILAVFMKDSYLNERIGAINEALNKASQSQSIDYAGLEQDYDINLIETDNDGNIVYISDGMPMHGMIRRQLGSMMGGGMQGKAQYFHMGSNNTKYALLSAAAPNGGYLYAVVSLVGVEEAAGLLMKQLWIVTVALLIFSLVLAVILSKKFSLPVRRLTLAARQMAGGNLDIALPIPSRDEIGELTSTLNELGGELRKTEILRRELIANVSHELKTPLTIIQGYAETVRDVSWPNEEKRTSQLTMISDEASRLSKMVTDILDYSKLRAGVNVLSVSVFQACPVLTETIERLALEAEKRNLSIELHCTEGLIKFDQSRMVQVINNLISNAVNHAAGGTSIDVRAVKQQQNYRISVKNFGAVIPADELKNIWERYYRADRAHADPMGTGLGLSIVKSILEQHHVAYGVESKDGVTVFWFETLPVDYPNAPAPHK